MAIKYGGLPYDEAIAFLKQKANVKTRTWDDLKTGAHIKTFTVAGATNDALLADFRVAVEHYQKQGLTITDFRRDFDKIVKRYGWNYNGRRGWRTRVIYDTNLRTAHAAGKWHKIQETKKERPYLQYITVGDGRVRDEHAGWDGIILPVDDPFWKTHYPPNGWGCRCTVRTLSKDEAKRLGISPSPKITKTERINTKTGEVYGDVPVGIDTGWDYNVGSKDLYTDLTDIYRSAPVNVAEVLLTKLVSNEHVLTGWLAEPAKRFLPVAKLPADLQKSLNADNDLLLLSNATLRKQIQNHPELTADDFGKIPETIKNGVVLKDRKQAITIIHNNYILGIHKTKINENMIDTFYKADKGEIKRRLNKGSAAKK